MKLEISLKVHSNMEHGSTGVGTGNAENDANDGGENMGYFSNLFEYEKSYPAIMKDYKFKFLKSEADENKSWVYKYNVITNEKQYGMTEQD